MRNFFMPSQSYLKSLPVHDSHKVKYLIDGSFIFFIAFILFSIALIASKFLLSGLLCLLSSLFFLNSLLLIKKEKIYKAANCSSIGLMIAIIVILFFTPDSDTSLIFYRNACFIITMAIFNQLVSIKKFQINLFFGGSTLIWIINDIKIFSYHYGLSHSATISAIVICSIAIYVANTVLVILNRFNQKLVEDAVNSQEEASKNLNSITKIIEDSKSGLEVGNRLYQSTQNATNNIKELTTIFQTVANNSSTLAHESTTASQTSRQVKSQSEQMLQTVTAQNVSIESTNQAMDEMSKSLEEMSQIAGNHKEKMSQIANNLDSQLNLINTIVGQVERVKESSENIAHFVNTVNKISEKTGLLAMNASIEAAHAGEAGKGFSVIAQEIRTLSNNTTANASQITNDLQENTEIVSLTSKSVSTFKDFTQKTTAELRNTIQGIEQILAGIQNINEETKTIMDSLKNVVDQSHETGYLAGIVVSEIEDQNSALEKMEKISNYLQNSVEGMDSQVNEIKDVISGIEKEAVNNVEVSKKITGSLK
ncbi:MAG: hypothetical protein K5866_01085 [Treponema sp.]|nr:hypothetical protein [Treponema sp.]